MPLPQAIYEVKEGYNRQDFIDRFFDSSVDITSIVVRDFNSNLIPLGFKFFNPREEFDDAAREAMAYSAETTKSARLDAKRNASLAKNPIARGLISSANNPIHMEYWEKTRREHHVMEKERKISVTLSDQPNSASPELVERIVRAIIDKPKQPRRRHKLAGTSDLIAETIPLDI